MSLTRSQGGQTGRRGTHLHKGPLSCYNTQPADGGSPRRQIWPRGWATPPRCDSLGTFRCLESGGGDDEVHPDGEEHHDQAGPGDEALGAEGVGVTGLGPDVGGVDGGVPVHVGAVLVGVAEHAVALPLAARGVLPASLLHGGRLAAEVETDGGVLDGVEALDADLLHLVGLDRGVDGDTAGLGLLGHGGTVEGRDAKGLHGDG